MKLIQGGLVKTITGGDIENGQILIDGGKIVAVGQNLDVPAGTEIIDVAGCIVTPGFVDAHPHRHARGGEPLGGGNDEQYSARLRRKSAPSTASTRGTKHSATRLARRDDGGDRPGSANVLGGTFVAMKLLRRLRGRHDSQISGGDEDCVRREPQGRLRPERPKMPVTRMAVSGDAARDALQAQRYAKEIEEAEKDATKTRPFDMKLEALLPVLRRRFRSRRMPTARTTS